MSCRECRCRRHSRLASNTCCGCAASAASAGHTGAAAQQAAGVRLCSCRCCGRHSWAWRRCNASSSGWCGAPAACAGAAAAPTEGMVGSSRCTWCCCTRNAAGQRAPCASRCWRCRRHGWQHRASGGVRGRGGTTAVSRLHHGWCRLPHCSCMCRNMHCVRSRCCRGRCRCRHRWAGQAAAARRRRRVAARGAVAIVGLHLLAALHLSKDAGPWGRTQTKQRSVGGLAGLRQHRAWLQGQLIAHAQRRWRYERSCRPTAASPEPSSPGGTPSWELLWVLYADP